MTSEEQRSGRRERRRGITRYVVPHASYRWFVQATVIGALVGAVALGLCLWGYSRYLTSTLASSGVLEDDFFRRTVTAYAGDLLQMALMAFGLFVVFMMLLSGYLFHKVAGPMYRLKTYLEQLLAEGSAGTLRFRDGDQFQEVAELVNKAVGRS